MKWWGWHSKCKKEIRRKNFFPQQIVSKMKKLLGPWIVLFCGKRKPKWQHIDDDVIARVDLFLATSPHRYRRFVSSLVSTVILLNAFRFRYSKRQCTLICLLALRVHMLTDDNIKDGSLFISKTKYEWWEIWDFLDDCKVVCANEGEFYPVILVVDEVSANCHYSDGAYLIMTFTAHWLHVLGNVQSKSRIHPCRFHIDVAEIVFPSSTEHIERLFQC